jgi:beta-lactamase superfamily II metal-dependent hydrolase
MKIPRIPVSLVAVACLSMAAYANSQNKALDVYWIDSEGGGSTLIVTPTNESVLIDAGNPGGRDPARIVAAVKAAGLTKIDYLLITHWHGDHFGGSAELAELIPIGTIYQRAIPEGDPDGKTATTFPLRSKSFKAIPAKREALAPGVVIPVHGVAGGARLEIRCLAADQKFIEPTAAQRAAKPQDLGTASAHPPETDIDNDNSAVFLVSFGDFRFFDGGDLTWAHEPKLVQPVNLVGSVDVYQTNHHGLNRSNNPIFVRGISPTVSVMNNGPRKGGSAEILAMLKELPSLKASYQLHKSMNVPPADNPPDAFIANLEEAKPADKCPANTIQMSVAPDGKNYTISIPANGHSTTYATKAK